MSLDNKKQRTASGHSLKMRNTLKDNGQGSSQPAVSTNHDSPDVQCKRKALQAKLKRAQKLLAEYRARSDENVQEYLTVITSYQNPKEHQEEMRQFDLNNLQLSENIRKLMLKINEYEQQLRQLSVRQAIATEPAKRPSSPRQEVKSSTPVGKPAHSESASVSHFYALTPEDQSSEADTKSCSLNEQDRVLHEILDVILAVERNQDRYSSTMTELRSIVARLTEEVRDLVDLHQMEMSHLRSELRRMEDKLSYTTHEQHSWLEDKFSSLFDKLALIETHASRASSKSAGLIGYVGSFTAFRKSKQDQTPEYEEDIGIFYNCVIAPVLNLIFSLLAIAIGLTSTAAHAADMLLASRYFRPLILPFTILLATFLYYFSYCKARSLTPNATKP